MSRTADQTKALSALEENPQPITAFVRTKLRTQYQELKQLCIDLKLSKKQTREQY